MVQFASTPSPRPSPAQGEGVNIPSPWRLTTRQFYEGVWRGHFIFFYAVTPKAEGRNDEVRELIFSDQNSEVAMVAIPDDMAPESQFLFYKAQMVSARIGWTPPSLYNPRLKDRLFRVTVPTLLVSAAGDRLVPTAVADVYQAGLPEAELVRVAGAAHAIWLEQPQHTAEIVTRFLQ